MKQLAAPLIGGGILMAAYLGLRPYGDQSTDPATIAAAFADWRWVASHVCGLLALAQFGRLTQRLEDLSRGEGRPSRLARFARATGLGGALLVLPYYGAETFGLHALGRARLDDPTFPLVALTEAVRNQPAALTLFGAGLISLAVSAVLTSLAWRQFARPSWAPWPLAALMIGFLPQFYLPAAGRIGYGIAYLIAAVVWLAAASRHQHSAASDHQMTSGVTTRPAT